MAQSKQLKKSAKSGEYKTVEQISAGGVAFRAKNSRFEVVITLVNDKGRWQLPKGLIDKGESAETAALREVREEAGIEAELLEKLETVEYWYFGKHKGEQVRFHKLVHFYLMKYTGGDIADHDHEVLEARWVSIDEAIKMLAFKGEKETAAKAKELLRKRYE